MVFGLAYDGTNLFAGCWNGNVYYNTTPTNPATWNPLPNAAPGGGSTFYCLGYDGTFLCASCYDGNLYYNANPVGGGVWFRADSPGGSVTYSLTHDGTNLYAGCRDGNVYYNSNPPGGTWTSAGYPYGAGSGVYSLVHDGTNLYASCLTEYVYWAQSTFTVSAWGPGGDGTAIPSSQDVAVGQNATINITPDAGYFLESITDNGTPVASPSSPYVITDVQENHNVFVTFTSTDPGPSPGPPTPNYTFYFAEGYTGLGFQEYLCIGNSGNTDVTAQVTYMFNDGIVLGQDVPVSANSRATVNVNNVVGAEREVSMTVTSDSANLVAERPQYFNYQGPNQRNWKGGSDVVGYSPGADSAQNWYFAEGTTRGEFEEWITVLNPGSQVANLTFRYMVEGEGETVKAETVGANTRATFSAANHVGLEKNVSLHLESDQNVVAERPIYFNYQGLAQRNWQGGHCVVGVNSPATEWSFAEGTTRDNAVDGTFEEWLTLQNPNDDAIVVRATYQLGEGQGDPIDRYHAVPGKERLTISVNEEIGPDKDTSVNLTSDSDFIAERPIYFDYHGIYPGGHDVLGAKASATTWFFAEGYTGPGFEEWLCVQNTGDTQANLTINYYPEGAAPIVKYHAVLPNTRETINVNTDVGPNMQISARVESDQPVIAERPMYFNFNGVWPGGHDVVGY